MNKSIISDQLKHDYPDYKIYLDADSRMVVADNHKMSLLNSSDALQTMNIFSRSGRSFYQAITQLLCSNYNIIPKEGSYADHLIIRQEDLNKYKVQKLAKKWGIGFLETNENIQAVGVDYDIKKNLLLESPEVPEELSKEEYFPENQEAFSCLTAETEDEGWAELEEIKFDDEIKFLEKGIEFVEAMEELEAVDEEIKNKLEEFDSVEENEKKKSNKGIFNFIYNILKF